MSIYTSIMHLLEAQIHNRERIEEGKPTDIDSNISKAYVNCAYTGKSGNLQE
jgi:hypothetical protein